MVWTDIGCLYRLWLERKQMDYNLIMYIGTGLIIGGFLLFIYCEHKIRQADKELWRQEQLHKSFMRHKDASR